MHEIMKYFLFTENQEQCLNLSLSVAHRPGGHVRQSSSIEIPLLGYRHDVRRLVRRSSPLPDLDIVAPNDLPVCDDRLRVLRRHLANLHSSTAVAGMSRHKGQEQEQEQRRPAAGLSYLCNGIDSRLLHLRGHVASRTAEVEVPATGHHVVVEQLRVLLDTVLQTRMSVNFRADTV